MHQHMNDKEMVNDILNTCKSGLTAYATAISETANQELRQTLQQIRNSDELFQYQLFQLAAQKGFYQPAANASPQQMQEVKSQLC